VNSGAFADRAGTRLARCRDGGIPPDNLNTEANMDDTTIEVEGLEVQELDGDEETFAPHVPGGHQRWQGQLRRAGSADELPGPHRYRDYPTWLTTLAKAPAEEELAA
jgi:hypothetical protein